MKNHRFVIGILMTLSAFSTLAFGLRAAGYIWNTTPSVPTGLWRVHAGELKRGAIVVLCPVDTEVFRLAREAQFVPAGSCAGNYEPLLKPLAALPGDVVEVSGDGIRVNGLKLLNSLPLRGARFDEEHPLLPYPAGIYVVPQGEVWLVSSFNPESFDSRYFGPLPSQQVLGIAEPIWVSNVSP